MSEPFASDDGTGAAGPRTRRFHNKSRLGCKGCKERRIKCDETRPVCSNCARRDVPCEYSKEKNSKGSNDDQDEPIAPVRKSRKRPESPPKKNFTFVDVSPGSGVAKKRKRTDQSPDTSKIVPSSSSPGVNTTNQDGNESDVGSQHDNLMLILRHHVESPAADFETSGTDQSRINLSPSDSPLMLDEEYERRTTPPVISSIQKWQSSQSTAFKQGYPGIKMNPQDYNLINAYRTLTCETFPYATATNNPWKSMTFEFQFKDPHLYHISLALTSAHLRYLNDTPTPSAVEISHYVKGLSLFREALHKRRTLDLPEKKLEAGQVIHSPVTLDVARQVQALFATSAMVGVYIWASATEDIHAWIESKLSMVIGTREIVHGFWEGSTLSRFRDAVDGAFPLLTAKLVKSLNVGHVKLPALEMLARTPEVFPKHSATVPAAIMSLDQAENVQEAKLPDEDHPDQKRDIYDVQVGTLFPENSDLVKITNGESVVDLGSIHRLVCIVTAVTSDPPASPEMLKWAMRLIFVWPGLCATDLLGRVRMRDPKAYMLLAYYYAALIKMKQLGTPQLFDMADDGWCNHHTDEIMKAWWMTKTPRLLLRGILDWLGPEWEEWMTWPIQVLNEEETAEQERAERIWEPAVSTWDGSWGVEMADTLPR